MKKKLYNCILILLCAGAFIACKRSIVITISNPQEGKLHATHSLVENGEKVFELDSVSAPKAVYMQFCKIGGKDVLSFLNKYNSSIYLYDYNEGDLLGIYNFGKDIIKPGAYYIINEDSVYVLDMAKMNLTLFNPKQNAQTDVISLKGKEGKDWPIKLPQYNLFTSNPIIKIGDELIMTGQLFWSIPAKAIQTFHFSANIGIQSKKLKFEHCYPEELYGHDSNWEGGQQTAPHATVSPDGNLIYSFPPSHNLYITAPHADSYRKVYGGSNDAGDISSIDYQNKEETPEDIISANYVMQDMYGPIIYDGYRSVYYRFLLKKVTDKQKSNSIPNKEINIVIMDKDFHYLGETTIGNGKKWNIQNAFITQEGLNIEYLSPENLDEDHLVFKVFQLK